MCKIIGVLYNVLCHNRTRMTVITTAVCITITADTSQINLVMYTFLFLFWSFFYVQLYTIRVAVLGQ